MTSSGSLVVSRAKVTQRFLARFRFQPFKKCFSMQCSIVFVPGDFKPNSPRRMFCSFKCFEAHWRAKLSQYLEEQSSRVSAGHESNDRQTVFLKSCSQARSLGNCYCF